jgi:hypothetical protein
VLPFVSSRVAVATQVPVEIMLVVHPESTIWEAGPGLMVSTWVPEDGTPPVTDTVIVSLPEVESTRYAVTAELFAGRVTVVAAVPPVEAV